MVTSQGMGSGLTKWTAVEGEALSPLQLLGLPG